MDEIRQYQNMYRKVRIRAMCFFDTIDAYYHATHKTFLDQMPYPQPVLVVVGIRVDCLVCHIGLKRVGCEMPRVKASGSPASSIVLS
jgi:hypothetical protein